MATKNERIAKNTALLYFRQLLTMLLSLYAVRVILSTIGAVDYGIYNVVGGIVTMFSFLSSTMASASERFFAFELGRKDYDKLKKVFSLTLICYGVIALFILVLAETLGLWFLNNRMVIPPERMNAANWIYQFSILSFMATMFAVPYNALIIANERMNVYAYVSIIEVTLKLAIVYLLATMSGFDKLKLYGILSFVTTCFITFIYRTYCRKNIPECRFSFFWNRDMFKQIVSYSLWNLFGVIAAILKDQGINLLLNVFFNPVVNAARAVAFQINNSLSQFITNFAMAMNPQIVKYYATNEKGQMLKLVFQGSKFSFFLMLVVSMPVLLETNYILSIWLKSIPLHLVVFTQLVIIGTLIDSLSSPLITSALATGNIRKYQIVVGGILMMNLPVSYLFLKMGFAVEITMYIAIIISITCLIARLIMLRTLVELDIYKYFRQVLFPVIIVFVLAYLLPLFIHLKLETGVVRLVLVVFSGFLTCLLSVYFAGFSREDKLLFTQIINEKILKKDANQKRDINT